MDWARPWLAPLRASGQAAAAGVARGLSVAQALNAASVAGVAGAAGAAGAGSAAPMRFVPQAALPAGMAYERFIFETQSVPTRDNLHDFFNGLCWQHFPATKARLNQLQAAEIAAQGVGPRRGPVRDALTLFDENAAFLIAPPVLHQALAERAWRRLFVELRPLWVEARLVLFGHALLEKLAAPRKAITAHVYTGVRLDGGRSMDGEGEGEGEELDQRIAASLHAETLARKPFLPLPVLGVPGWWVGNEDVSFYDDPLVFRPSRVSSINTTTDAA